MRPNLTSNIRVAPDTRRVGQALDKTLKDLSRIEQQRIADEQQKVNEYEKTLAKSYQEVADRDRDEFIQKRKQFEDQLNEIYRKSGGELSYEDQKKINAMTQEIDDFVGTSQDLQEDYKKQMKEIAQNPDKYDKERIQKNLDNIMNQKLRDRAKQWYDYDWMEPNVEKVDITDLAKQGQQLIKEEDESIMPVGEPQAGQQTFKTIKGRNDAAVRNWAKNAFEQNKQSLQKHYNINSPEELYEQTKQYFGDRSELNQRKAQEGSSRFTSKNGQYQYFPTQEEIPLNKKGDKTGEVRSYTTVPGQGVNNIEYLGQQVDIENAKVMPTLKGDHKVWVSDSGDRVKIVYDENQLSKKERKNGYIKSKGEFLTSREARELGEDNIEYKPYVFFQAPKETEGTKLDQMIEGAAQQASGIEGGGDVTMNFFTKGDKKLAYVPYDEDSDLRNALVGHKDWGREKDEYLMGVTQQANKRTKRSHFHNKFK